jgi:hypothetical protein
MLHFPLENNHTFSYLKNQPQRYYWYVRNLIINYITIQHSTVGTRCLPSKSIWCFFSSSIYFQFFGNYKLILNFLYGWNGKKKPYIFFWFRTKISWFPLFLMLRTFSIVFFLWIAHSSSCCLCNWTNFLIIKELFNAYRHFYKTRINEDTKTS